MVWAIYHRGIQHTEVFTDKNILVAKAKELGIVAHAHLQDYNRRNSFKLLSLHNGYEVRTEQGVKRDIKNAIFEEQKGLCFYCDKAIPLHGNGKGTVDHKVARSKGGTNDRKNLCWCCIECNHAKANLSVAQFTNGRLL